MNTPISISGIGSLSPLGATLGEAWKSYLSGNPNFETRELRGKERIVAPLPSASERIIKELQAERSSYKYLDRSVILALAAARQAVKNIVFDGRRTGVNIGSSRGATQLFERYHTQFEKQEPISPYTSPTTTLGNISSWIGQDLGWEGIHIDHSVTCSTAMHALLNGVAWLKADMVDIFLAGGSEAAITPFTIAQMGSLKLYATGNGSYPCRSLDFDKKRNTMILGEGASVAVLEKGISSRTLGVISGYGFASERLEHNSSISEDAKCFQKSMRRALEHAGLNSVDAIIMHAPGTIKGDLAELNAIKKVFGNELPPLTSNKHLIGHTFAASGMLSIEMALLMLKNKKWIPNPFRNDTPNSEMKHIMINAVGFGGNAVSIILSDH